MANRTPKSYQEQIDEGNIIRETTKPQLDVEALNERVNTLEELLVIVLNNANNKEALELVQSYLLKHRPHYQHYRIGFN